MKQFLTVLITLYSFFYFNNSHGQTNNVMAGLRESYQLQQAISPSPEMRSIMRFDQVEVSSYTGIPDISIPLYSFYFNKDLDINLSLKYHPDAVKKEERAGSTGLGWSLVGGGSITRVVRGLPDDKISAIGEFPYRGLHCTKDINTANDLDDFMNNPEAYTQADGLAQLHDKLFEAYEGNTYDTQYDIYYYNFMGYSGSFYLKFNDNSNKFQVVKLDHNNLKISAKELNRNINNVYVNREYIVDSFTIYDEKGNKFIFEDKSYTKLSKYYNNDYFFGRNKETNFLPDEGEYISTYHLSNITPYTYSEPKINFYYEEYIENYDEKNAVIKNELLEYTESSVDAWISEARREGHDMRSQFLPKKATYSNRVIHKTQKIKLISILGAGTINFNYSGGRTDNNYSILPNSELVKLDLIKIYSNNGIISGGTLVKQIKFDYGYSSLSFRNEYSSFQTLQKMLLKKITEYKEAESDTNKRIYRFSYKKPDLSSEYLGEDAWGYFSTIYTAINDAVQYSIDTQNMNTLVLEKMELPTGGAVIYDFEPHTYSYIGADKILSGIPRTRKNEIGGGLRIKTIGFFDDKNVSAGYYTQGLSSPSPSKELHYNYNLPDEVALSSGSLSFAKPVFKYQRDYDYFVEYAYQVSNGQYIEKYITGNDSSGRLKFNVTTNYNNIYSLLTQGSNVGYKNVTITERDNGKRVLTFTSPIDFPEENYTITYPFLPSANVDYKRGLLINEKIYNSTNSLVSELTNEYDYEQAEVTTGIVPFYRHGHNCRKTVCNPGARPTAYLINTTTSTSGASCHPGYDFIGDVSQYYNINRAYCTNTYELMNYKLEKRIVGWAKLKKSSKTQYLPDSSNAITNSTEYGYNAINKKANIIKQLVGNDVYTTELDYLNTSTGVGGIFSGNNYNRISDISKATQKYNSEVLSTEKVIFKDINPANTGGGIIRIGSEMYVPKEIQASKGDQALETVQTITRLDERGNPLEVLNRNGRYTSFIWGHNKTYLVAVIENCKFEEIENLPVYATIISRTDANGATEAQLTGNYNELKNTLGLTKKMTAIIYNTGIGVVTKIDANGQTTSYKYNTLGNLSEIRDNNNNILSQYIEFYKN